MEFLQINGLPILIIVALLIALIFIERKFSLISKTFGISANKFYIIYAVLALLILVLNFVAIHYFGSWQALLLTTVGIAIAVFVLFKLFKSRKQADEIEVETDEQE